MTSIDEASSAVGGNAEQARELAGGIIAAKETLDELAGAMAALGLDAKTGQAQGASSRAEELAGHANGLAEALDQLRAQVEALKGLLASAGGGAVSASQPQGKGGSTTRPSLPPDPGRKPGGSPEPVERGSSSENQAAIRGENEAAVILARNGYRIDQQPPLKANGKRPDYFMEGDHWDCASVFTSKAERVRKSIKAKVSPKDGRVQAHRIVLNMDVEHQGRRTSLTANDIEGLLRRKPLADLHELKVIMNGRVHDIDLGG